MSTETAQWEADHLSPTMRRALLAIARVRGFGGIPSTVGEGTVKALRRRALIMGPILTEHGDEVVAILKAETLAVIGGSTVSAAPGEVRS